MYYESNELTHFGVKGMKWGVRKARRQMASVTKRRREDISDEEALQFKKDVKDAKRNRLRQDVDGDYANAVYKQVDKDRAKRTVTSVLGVIGGTAVAGYAATVGIALAGRNFVQKGADVWQHINQ